MSDKKDKWDNDSRFVNSDGGFVIDQSEMEDDWLIPPQKPKEQKEQKDRFPLDE